ncbi:MAG TPA: hypothetical protein VGN09_13450 [Vicinamibacteria bacterium]|jgi:hypothetical protein
MKRKPTRHNELLERALACERSMNDTLAKDWLANGGTSRPACFNESDPDFIAALIADPAFLAHHEAHWIGATD